MTIDRWSGGLTYRACQESASSGARSSRSRIAHRRALAAAAAVVISLAVPQTPAAASQSPPEVLLSNDGVTFTTSLGREVLGGIGHVVPGDRMTDIFWVKNASDTAARLRIDLIGPSFDDRALAEATSITMAPATSGDIRTVTVAEAWENGSCTVLTNDLVLGPGQVVEVESEAVVASDLGQRAGDLGREGVRGSVFADFRVLLTDAQVFPETECFPSFSADDLPTTGTAPPILLTVFAVISLGVGMLLAMRSRLRRRE